MVGEFAYEEILRPVRVPGPSDHDGAQPTPATTPPRTVACPSRTRVSSTPCPSTAVRTAIRTAVRTEAGNSASALAGAPTAVGASTSRA
ncbi:hypothetical protein NKH77_38140 [Streptomyces sp. M19]